jgi:hypothetical protein
MQRILRKLENFFLNPVRERDNQPPPCVGGAKKVLTFGTICHTILKHEDGSALRRRVSVRGSRNHLAKRVALFIGI